MGGQYGGRRRPRLCLPAKGRKPTCLLMPYPPPAASCTLGRVRVALNHLSTTERWDRPVFALLRLVMALGARAFRLLLLVGVLVEFLRSL